MSFTDKVSSLLLGVFLGLILIGLIVISVLLKSSIEHKREHQSSLRPLETMLFSLEVEKLTTTSLDEIKKIERKIFLKIHAIKDLNKKIKDLDEFVAFLVKIVLSLMTLLGLMVAVINMNYKYLHRLHSFITTTASGTEKKQNLVLINKKDRNEVVIGVYLKGQKGEVVEVLKLSDTPEKIDSFGYFSKELKTNVDIGYANPNNYYSVYAVLSDGDELKCPAVTLFKGTQATRVIPKSSIKIT